MSERLRILTWHVHGSYLYYLTQANCDFYLPVTADRAHGYGGRGVGYPWGSNVHEVPVERVRDLHLDAILFQNRKHYEQDQYQILSKKQLRLPKLFVEHDPPQQVPTETVHPVADTSTVLVHVTDFNRLMWDSGGAPTTVIDHGVVVPAVEYKGNLDRGIVVVNNLKPRGRRLGYDVFEYVRQHVPLDIIGLGSEEIGGLGALPHDELPEFIAQYRFFFNPIRYTSLGLSIIEAMMVGLPIVGLQTTELTSVIESGVHGYVALNPDNLIGCMDKLIESPKLAAVLGANARRAALDRFGIDRFAQDWEQLFVAVCSGRYPAPFLSKRSSAPASIKPSAATVSA